MLSSLTRFTVALALTSSILGAVIPITTPTTSSTATATAIETVRLSQTKGLTGALFKNSVHEKIYLSEASAATPTTEGGLSAVRRSGELWRGREHEEVDPSVVTSTGPALPRRSGELWLGVEHEEIARADPPLPRRSGELWRGLEHEEIPTSYI